MCGFLLVVFNKKKLWLDGTIGSQLTILQGLELLLEQLGLMGGSGLAPGLRL